MICAEICAVGCGATKAGVSGSTKAAACAAASSPEDLSLSFCGAGLPASASVNGLFDADPGAPGGSSGKAAKPGMIEVTVSPPASPCAATSDASAGFGDRDSAVDGSAATSPARSAAKGELEPLLETGCAAPLGRASGTVAMNGMTGILIKRPAWRR
jgi:hypothetical protein